MDIQIKITGVDAEQRGESADVTVYSEGGSVFSRTTMTAAAQGQGAVVENLNVPPHGYFTVSNFTAGPVYDPVQRAAVPGDD